MDKQKSSIGDPQIIYKNMGGREGEREIKRGKEREFQIFCIASNG